MLYGKKQVNSLHSSNFKLVKFIGLSNGRQVSDGVDVREAMRELSPADKTAKVVELVMPGDVNIYAIPNGGHVRLCSSCMNENEDRKSFIENMYGPLVLEGKAEDWASCSHCLAQNVPEGYQFSD